MPNVAFLVAASPTPAFFSQVAALELSLERRRWCRWVPSLAVYLAGSGGEDSYRRWRPHLPSVQVIWSPADRFDREGDWAQADDVFRLAPRDADVLVALDADMLLVGDLEPLLDAVLARRSVAGVIAHYPFPLATGDDTQSAWRRLASGIVEELPPFDHAHSLMRPTEPASRRMTPFYVNFGAVFFPRDVFDAVAPAYLRIRPLLRDRLLDPDFSGQAAITLAVASTGTASWALPLRYNFPNDPLALELHPEDAASPVLLHYLRTTNFDRHRIFLDADRYDRFLGLRLEGVDHLAQALIRTTIGERFPFR